MNHLWKRSLSLIMAIFMVLSLIPANPVHVHAAENVAYHYVDTTNKHDDGLKGNAAKNYDLKSTGFYAYEIKENGYLTFKLQDQTFTNGFDGRATLEVEFLTKYPSHFTVKYIDKDSNPKIATPIATRAGTSGATIFVYEVRDAGFNGNIVADGDAIGIQNTNEESVYIRSVKITKGLCNHVLSSTDCETVAKTCGICKATQTKLTAHSWVAADCDTNETCKYCPKTQGEPLGHAWGKWTSNEDGTHTRVCATDASHTENGDCNESGTDGACSVCGYKVPAVEELPEYVVLPEGVTVESFGDDTVTDGTYYYATLVDALTGIHLTGNRVLYCKPGADVGKMTHGHVCDNLTVYGNGASVTGGEQDFEIGQYKYCHNGANVCQGITDDLTLTVKYLNGSGAWGNRSTDDVVNLVFENCQDMGRIYINGIGGENHISLTDCSFTSNVAGDCKVYSNANGSVKLTRVDFSNVNVPVNLNHKVAGKQIVEITDCSFTNCGHGDYDYAAPVRVLSSVEGGESELTVSGCTFAGTIANKQGQTADILLDYAVGTTNATVNGTAANVTVEAEENVGTETVIAKEESKDFTNVVETPIVPSAEISNLTETVWSVSDEEDREAFNVQLKKINAANSLVVEVYHNEILLTTTELKDSLLPVVDSANNSEGFNRLTVNIVLWGRASSSWDTKVETANLTEDNIPNYIKVYSDGVLVAEGERTFDAAWIAAYKGLDSTTKSEVKVATLAELQAALASDSDLPIVITKQIVIGADETVTIDLNGKTVNAGWDDEAAEKHIYVIDNKGTLTITGNGVINTRGIFNYGTLTLENGTINAIDGNGGYGVRNYAGSFTMNGGTIATTLEDDHKVDEGGYDASTVRVDEGATFEMNGGTINNICDFTVAIDNYGTATIKGGAIISVHTTVANDGTLTIEGGEFTCNGLHNVTAHVVWTSGGKTTINGGIFNAKKNYNGFALDADGGIVTVNGGTFNGSATACDADCTINHGKTGINNAIYVNGNNVVVTVNGGTFDYGVSYSKGSLSIKGGIWKNANKVVSDHVAEGYEFDSTTGTVVESKVFVAEVNGTQYETLGEAVAALQDGETLKILTGFTAEANQFVELNGKKNVTITAAEGAVIEGNIQVGYHASHIDGADRTNSTLTIDGLTVNGTLTVCSNDANFVITNNKAAQLTVKTYREGMNITIEGNTADGSIGTAANSYGMFVVPNATAYNLVVKGNTFENVNSHAFVVQGCGDGSAVTYAESIAVTNNKFVSWGLGGKDNRAAFKIWADTKYAPIEGSDVGQTTDAMRELANAIEAGGNIFESTASNTVEVDVYGIAADLKDIPEVAPKQVEVATLAELQAALADNSNDLSIVVTAEIKIPAGTTDVLDLNGKTVTSAYQANSTSKHIYPLNVYGDLTIQDTKGNGSISGRGIFVQAGSKLTVASGSIYAIDSNGGSVLFMYGGDVVINGGHVEQKAEGTYNFAIQAPTGSTVTVNGGWVGGNHGAIAATGGQAVINDGTLVCTGSAGMTDNVVYSSGDGSITINGGNFIADKDIPSGGACVYDANGGVTINGGTFGNSSGGDVWGTTGTTIKGGTFENLIEKQHIAPGYELGEDGKVVASFVAKVGEQGYTTLAEAIANANGGEVEILCDITEELDDISNVTLTTKVAEGVTITNTYAGWTGFDNVTVGAGVTVASPLIFSGEGENTILGKLVVGSFEEGTYYHGYDAKTTVKDGGSLVINGTTILRYNKNAESGLYIYGDGNKDTVEYDCAYYIGAYSGTLYAENATIEAGYFLLKNSYDSAAYADINMTLDNSTLTIVSTTDTQDSFIIDDQAHLTLKNGAAIADVRDFNVLAGTNLTLSVDESSSISATYMNIAEDVPFEKVQNPDGSFTMAPAVTYVAQIGDNKYESLEAAVNAAEAGDTITLINDAVISNNNAYGIMIGKAITIDGNGKTITVGEGYSNEYALLYLYAVNGTVTIKNLTFDGVKSGAAVWAHDADLVIENCVFQNGNHTQVQGLVRTTTSNLTVKNSKFLNNNCNFAITFNFDAAENDTMIVEGCEFSGNIVNDTAVIYYVDGASSTIKNSSFVNNTIVSASHGAVLYYSKGTNGTVTGNIFSGNSITAAGARASVLALEDGTAATGNVFTGNTFSSSASGTTYVATVLNKADKETAGVVISANYWNGGEPDYIASKDAPTEIENYYTTYVDGVMGGLTEVASFVAEVNGTQYESLADAAAAAKAGDEIVLIADAYIAEGTDVTIPNGVTLNGNGFAIYASGADHNTTTSYGYVVVGGELTIKGETKIEKFSASYYNHTVNIGEGASLEVFGKNRVTVGYGNTFNITGTLSKARTETKPSLSVAAGISFAGTSGVTFNVKNAYVSFGLASGKNLGGKFAFSFENSIVDFKNNLTFSSGSAVIDIDAKDSVLNMNSNLDLSIAGCDLTLDNSQVSVNSSMRNEGKITLTNGSTLTIRDEVALVEHGGNAGTITVDASTLTVGGTAANDPFDGRGTGSVNVINGGSASIGYISKTAVAVDTESSLAVQKIQDNSSVVIDAENYDGTSELNINIGSTDTSVVAVTVTGSDMLEVKNEDGKIVLAERTLSGEGTEANPYQINNVADLWLFAKIANAGNNFSGKYVKLTADIDLDQEDWTPISKFNGTFDGDGHKISNLWVTGSGNLGFFAQVADQTEHVSGTVKNVTFENATIISSNNQAGLIADARLGARITNVHLTGEVTIQGYRGVGGIVGAGFPVITDCSVEAEGTIHATYWGVGGILGFASDRGAQAKNVTVNGVGEGLSISSDLGGAGGVTGTPYGAATNGATVSNIEVSSNNNYYMAYVDASGTVNGTISVTDVAVKVNGEEIVGNDAVASIGKKGYFSLTDAIAAANAGDVINLVDNIELDATLTINKSITINGNGKKITTSSAFVGNASNAMIDIIKDITFNNVDFDGIKNVAVMRAVSANVVLDGCTVQNCEQTVAQGLLRLACGNATITDSQFLNNDCTMVVSFGYDAANDDDVMIIDNCVFEGNICRETAVVYFADGDYGKVTNTKFIDNTVTSAGNAATLYMGWGDGFEVSGCYFDGNTVTTTSATTKRFASAIFCDGCAVTGNVFGNNTATRNGETVSTVVAVGAYYGAADVSGNYWVDGSKPVKGDVYTVEYTRNPVAIDTYYTEGTVDAEGNVTLAGLKKMPAGKVAYRGYINDSDNREAIQIDLDKVFAENSFVIKLYDANGNLLTTTTYRNGGVDAASFTCNIVLWGTASGSWNTEIHAEKLTVANVPTKAEIWADGELVDSYEHASGSILADKLNDYKALDCIYKEAKIGNTYYVTLTDAIAAANAEETIELLADVTANSTLLIGKSITINGNDHKITSSATRIFRITTGNVQVTMNDLSMVSTAVRAGSVDSIRGISIDGGFTGIELTLNDCIVDFTDATATDYSYAINIVGGSNHTVTINGGSYEAANVINLWGDDHQVDVDGAVLTSIYGPNEWFHGAIVRVEGQIAKLEMTNNTFNGDHAKVVSYDSSASCDSVIDENNIDNTKRYVVKVGNTLYHTLEEAIAAADAGDTVKLLAVVAGSVVIEEGKNIVIDLNGKAIVGAMNAITNNGTLTINDSVGTGNVYTTDVEAQGRAAIINNGTLTINGGWFGDSNNDTTDRNAINRGNALKNYGTATINGGYFTNVSNQYISNAAYAYAINTLSGATTTINNATVYGDINGLIYSDGKTIVNDGSFTLGRPNEENNLWYLAYGDVEIKGGTWNRAFAVPSWNDGDPTFNGEVVVSGGKFNVDVEEKYCAEGFIPTKNADGTFGVKVGQFVAQVGETKYESLTDAMAAANAGDTVTIFEGTYAVPSMKAGITVVGEGNVLLEGTLSGTLENLTLKNLHIKGGNAQRWAYGKGDLVFENVTFEATSVYALHFDGIAEGTNLTYKDCTIIGWAAMGGSPASCTFDGCTIKDNGTYGVIRTYFPATIKDCTFDVDGANTTDAFQDGIHAVEGAIVTVENCTNANGDMKDIVNVHANSVVVLDGEKIRNVAKIGDTYYSTLENALAAAQAGQTIELLAPVVVAAGETLTLDKDVKIVYTSNVVGEDMFTVRGTLNVAAGTITYVNTDTTGSNVTVSTISCEPGSVLNVTGGTIENKTVKADGSSIYSYAIDLLTNGNLGDVTVNISGGTIYSDYMAIRQFNNGDACKNTLNITGGYIFGAKRAVQVHIDNTAAYTTITGGKIEGGNYALCLFANNNENLTVSDGEFLGGIYSATNGFITGGTFDSAVDDAYIAEDYVLVDNGDGTFGVVSIVEAGYVAQNAETGEYYDDVFAALNAATAGQTVKLITDAEAPYFIVKTGVTLDLNGYVLTTEYAAAVAGANVIDSARKGMLKTSVGSIVLNPANSMMAVYDDVNGGYIFTKFVFQLKQDTSYDGEGVKVNALFTAQNDMRVIELLKNGAATNDLILKVKLTWGNDEDTGVSSQDFTFKDATIAAVFSSNKGSWTSFGSQFFMIVSGFEGVENLKANLVVVSGTNATTVSPTTLELNY